MTAGKKINCVVVDDDPLFLTVLQGLIEKTTFLKLKSAHTNPLEADNAIKKEPVDLVFLDIEMPEMTGFELLQNLPKHTLVILVSSKKQYALEAFSFNVVDYLLKPIDNYARFLKAVFKAKNRFDKMGISEISGDAVFVKEGSILVKVKFDEIKYVEAFGDFVKVKTNNQNHIVYSTLKAMLGKLPSKEFLQVHRSFIVRVDRIDNLDMNNIQIGKTIIPISRSYKNDVLKRIKTL